MNAQQQHLLGTSAPTRRKHVQEGAYSNLRQRGTQANPLPGRVVQRGDQPVAWLLGSRCTHYRLAPAVMSSIFMANAH